MGLIDRYIADPDFSERHRLDVNASADIVIQAATLYRTDSDPFFRRMIALREAPMRVGRLIRGRRDAAPQPFSIDNFTLLERGPHEIVDGLAGRFWRSDFDLAPLTDGRDFIALDEPGIAKLTLNFAVHAVSEQASILSTEARIVCTDGAARRRFAPYWYLTRPVSGIIRQSTLRLIRTTSEASRPA